MIGPTDTDLSRRATAARALRLGGVLLWVAAAIHFLALPLLQHTVASRLPPEAYTFLWPPFALSFILDGVLLVPLGFTALYCAGGVLRGERWARVLGLMSALVVLSLPVVLVLVMGRGYFSATPFLIATIVVSAAGLAMTVPLVRLIRHAAV
ncbi:MAG: hypothetical protein ACREL4_07950 [Gemmatimonadales bacterium]